MRDHGIQSQKIQKLSEIEICFQYEYSFKEVK